MSDKPRENMDQRAEVTQRTIDRLKRFSERLESEQPLSEFYSCRKVILEIEMEPYTAEMVKETRKLLGVSQPLFAKFLNVSVSTVQKWERGENLPEGAACRLMDEIRRDPAYWRKRFKSMVKRVPSTQG